MMTKVFVHSVVLAGLLLVLPANRSNGSISVYIYPDASQNPVFEMSGQFDGPAGPALQGVVSFAFAPSSIARSSAQIYPFASPLATIVDLTTGGSADITGLNCYGQYYSYAYFELSPQLPTSPGDSLELISHGPVDLSNDSFGNFVPGNYTFSNISLGPTTFETQVVPEPASSVLMGLSLVACVVFLSIGYLQRQFEVGP